MSFKLFRKNSDEEPAQNTSERTDAAQNERTAAGHSAPSFAGRPELPTGQGLPELVKLMESYRVATLQLNQHGNEMTAVMDPSEKPERKTTVDTESTWFEPVAKLYTAAQASQDGPWRRVEIMISSVREGKRAVEIEYTYPNSEEQVREAYVQTVPSAPASEERSTGEKSASETAPAAGSKDTKSSGKTTPAEEKAPMSQPDQPTAGSADKPKGKEAPEVLGTPDTATKSPAAAEAAADPSAAVVPDVEAPAAPAKKTEAASEDLRPAGPGKGGKGSAAKDAPSKEAPSKGSGKAEKQEKSEQKASKKSSAEKSAAGDKASAADQAAQPVPAVVDDSRFEEKDRPAAGTPASAVAADLPDSVPSTAEQTDVSPSYASSGQSRSLKPSTTQLAAGNLVLTEAEVLQRIGEAQKILFGEGGSARDVSTVLIRVRALGSYYDALTHVRRNGFWDQRKTFDLIPEDALRILELKADSYQEGAGSPLAMMFRFTPGIPPEVSFSYEDEESFVKYKDRLPAQQYVEELRMFPRTGANIPEHMTDALTQWSL